MTPSERSAGLVNLIASTSIALVGQFMVSPLLVFKLNAQGYSASQIGLFTASVWLGILLATPFAPRIVQVIGARQALIQSLLIPLLTLAGMLVTQQILVWSLLYFIAGFAMSLRWIVAEACVAEIAPTERRGRVVGFYQMLIGASFVLAPTLLAWLGPVNPLAPYVALGCLFAGLTVTVFMPDIDGSRQDNDQPSDTGWRGLLAAAKASPFVLVAGVTAGFFELGIATLLPIYGLAIGFTSVAAALLLSVSGAGSSLVMVPLGEAADRFPVRTVMHACAGTTLLASMLLPLAASFTLLAWPLAFAWAAAGGALYTLAMIEIGHTRRGAALMRATSLLVLAYTAGSLIGPVAVGFAIEVSIRWALAVTFCAVAALGWWSLTRTFHRSPQ